MSAETGRLGLAGWSAFTSGAGFFASADASA
jgi:hypothetical protein